MKLAILHKSKGKMKILQTERRQTVKNLGSSPVQLKRSPPLYRGPSDVQEKKSETITEKRWSD